MTCNNANVPDGLLILLYIAAAVLGALGGEAVFVAWLLVRRRVSLGWVSTLLIALTVGSLCVWLINTIAALRAGLVAGVMGGKGVCGIFWGLQQEVGIGVAVALALAMILVGRAWGRTARS